MLKRKKNLRTFDKTAKINFDDSRNFFTEPTNTVRGAVPLR